MLDQAAVAFFGAFERKNGLHSARDIGRCYGEQFACNRDVERMKPSRFVERRGFDLIFLLRGFAGFQNTGMLFDKLFRPFAGKNFGYLAARKFLGYPV